MRIRGEVVAFDKRKRKGTFQVATGQDLPDGDYKFKVIGRQEDDSYIAAMRRSDTVLECRAIKRRGKFSLDVYSINMALQP